MSALCAWVWLDRSRIHCPQCTKTWHWTRSKPLPTRSCPKSQASGDAHRDLDFRFSSWPCERRLEILRTVGCGACGAITVEVAACPLYGECVPAPIKSLPGVQACMTCPERPRRCLSRAKP